MVPGDSAEPEREIITHTQEKICAFSQNVRNGIAVSLFITSVSPFALVADLVDVNPLFVVLAKLGLTFEECAKLRPLRTSHEKTPYHSGLCTAREIKTDDLQACLKMLTESQLKSEYRLLGLNLLFGDVTR